MWEVGYQPGRNIFIIRKSITTCLRGSIELFNYFRMKSTLPRIPRRIIKLFFLFFLILEEH